MSSSWAAAYTLKNLGTIGGLYSHAQAINATGQIVGDSTNTGTKHAVRFSGTGSGNTDLGVSGDGESYAYGINASGRRLAARRLEAPMCGPCFFRETGGNIDLGTLDPGGLDYSVASGINASGQIVGTSRRQSVSIEQ